MIRKKAIPRSKKPIKKVAKKRLDENKIYFEVTRPDKLKGDPYCQLNGPIEVFKKAGGQADWWPVCTKKAVEIHHKDGRENHLLNDVQSLLSACESKNRPHSCHNWAEEFSKQSIEIGISNARRLVGREILYKRKPPV